MSIFWGIVYELSLKKKKSGFDQILATSMSYKIQNDSSAIPVPLGIPDIWFLKHSAGLYKHPV
jgi:hypothetical protein